MIRMVYTRLSGATWLLLLSLIALLALPLVASAHEDSVFMSIRVYDGVDPADLDELERVTVEGFLPIINASDGFIAYYALRPLDGSLAAINIFQTREQALASNELARDFVVENLAPLLPNAPRIVEGAVDIGFVEMLDGMADGDVSSLHASLRIYDDFEAEDLNEFVTIVEDGFLPIMRASEGFFGYYLMNDGAGAVAAISIFDSENSAQASNEAARGFVAENLTAYLPEAPSITSGRVAIASLADVNEGANLIDQSIFVSVRVYDGVDPADQAEIVALTAEGFLPIMRESDGFVGYYLLPAGDMLAAVSFFDSPEQASASNEKARDFVAENLAPLLPNAPMIVEGELDLWFLGPADGMMPDQDFGALHAALRVYDNYDLTNREEAVELVETIFLPQQQEADGLFSYFTMDDGMDRVAALTVYDTEANALAANELAAEFAAEYMTDWIREEPTRVNGSLGLAAFADVNEGANLIEDEALDDKVFASVRVYSGVDPADQAEIARLTAEGFLPIIRESDGFVGYYLLPAGDMLAAVSLFETAEQATASTGMARDFVGAHLAPLLPNAPMIVEGTVEVSFVADADEMMMAEGGSSLHALLAIYDGFDMAHLDETVDLVGSMFLPALSEAGGLFRYYGISDGVDKAVALRIMDSEASLARGSEIAADFVAGYLGDWLPEDPLQVSGQLAVASLADVDMGANLIEGEAMDDSVFASVRLYDGVEPADQANIASLTAEGFLPIIRESDGFVGYYFLTAGDRLATVSLFDSAEQASASNNKAREFIAENLAPLLPKAPTIFEGLLSMNIVAAHSESGELYASIRFYDGFDLTHFDEANDLAHSQLLPALRELGGLFAQFAFNDGEDTVVGVSIFDSEEASMAANELGKAFTAEYLADWAPNPPAGIAGKLAIAAQAQINMGENLVGAPMAG